MLDAKACFDQNLHAMSIPVNEKKGIPRTTSIFLYRALRAIKFRISTAHGVSDQSFSVLDNPDRPLQGSGQGTAESVGLHVLVADNSNAALEANAHPRAILHSVNQEEDPYPNRPHFLWMIRHST
jgi:hypothetical protein